MSDETKTQEPENTHPEDNGATGKTFTQDEVNAIVSERLARERAKQGAPDDREAALTAREARLTCREYLTEISAPAVLLEVLDTSDPVKFRGAVEKLQAAPGRSVGLTTGFSHQGGHEVGGADDAIASAFKSKGK